MFAVYVTTNVTISGYGATWRMRRSDYNDSAKYVHSEGRHGLNLLGTVDTVVEGLRIVTRTNTSGSWLLGWPHRECLCEQEETGGDGISVWKGHNWTGPGPSDREDYCPNTRNVECACENLLVRDVVCDRNYRQVDRARLFCWVCCSRPAWRLFSQRAPFAGDVGHACREHDCGQQHVLQHSRHAASCVKS